MKAGRSDARSSDGAGCNRLAADCDGLANSSKLVDALHHKLSRRQRGLMGIETYVKAAVLLPLLSVDGRWHLLFEVRAQSLRRQPGEVCFPGGHLEPGDADPQAAAVRETCEELNLEPRQIRVLGPLDVLISPWRLLLYPYVGVLQDVEEIRPTREEIDRVFTVPLEEVRSARPETHWVEIRVVPRDDFPYEKIPGGRNYPWRRAARPELFFDFRGNVVWGLTARVLDHFRTLLDEL